LAASSLLPSMPLALPSSSEAPIAARLPSPLRAIRDPNQSLGLVFDALLAVAGVLIFAGLSAYDMHQLRRCYDEGGDDDRAAILGALTLYLDLLNLLLSLLRLTSRRR